MSGDTFPGINILHDGFASVRVRSHSPIPWKGSPAVEAKVDAAWDALTGTPNLTNGLLVRLNSATRAGSELLLDTSVTDYKHHVGTRREAALEDRANPLYVSALVETSDKHLLFGRRAAVDRGKGQYNVVAGSMHPVLDAPDGTVTPGIALYREFYEEFGPTLGAFLLGARPRMIFAPLHEPSGSLLYTLNLDLPADEARRLFDVHIEREQAFGRAVEFDDLRAVKAAPESLRAEYERLDSYRPSVQALLGHLAGTV